MILRVACVIFIVGYLSTPSYGCFILFYTDGDQVMVANHEDWFANDPAIRYMSRTPYRYASMVFTFMSEGWPQGGMNEKGLFFDAAQTPYQSLRTNDRLGKPPGYIWQYILDKASNVKEALLILEKYNIEELEEATVLLADRSGEAVIIGLHNNTIDIRRPTENYLIQTNFNQWQPELGEQKVCNRFMKAEQMISGKPPVTVEELKAILKETHQNELTVYSNIYDLKNLLVYTYVNRDFENPIVTSLPDYTDYGDCMVSMAELQENNLALHVCARDNVKPIRVVGVVQDAQTGSALPFTNIGIRGKNIGTLSDPDGKFEIVLPAYTVGDTVIFSSIGYKAFRLPVTTSMAISDMNVLLEPAPTMLEEVLIEEKKLHAKILRVGWMGGKDGVLPLDTIQGGGVVALLLESPSVPFYVEKLQVRLMFNSKAGAQFRFHLYAFDSVSEQPGKELLHEEIMLNVDKKFGWLRFDLSRYNLELSERKFFVGFEWIEDQKTRTQMIHGLREFEDWKMAEYKKGNSKVRYLNDDHGNNTGTLKYYGNMMDWPGFKNLPPFTGLMVETGKSNESLKYRTFERKTSFGEWTELQSTLNAVLTITY